MPLEKLNQIMYKTTRVWKIKNIQSDFGVNDSLKGTYLFYDFSSEFDDNDRWQVLVKFDRRSKYKNDWWITANVNPVNNSVLHHSTCTLYYLHRDNFYENIIRKVYKKGSTIIDSWNTCVVDSTNFQEIVNQLIPYDTLQLRVQLVTYLVDEPLIPSLPYCYVVPHYPRIFTPDAIQQLYENRNFSGDWIIKVQNSEFRAHKHVFNQFCPTLYQLINNNNDILNITEVNPEIFNMILEYIYTGYVNDLDDNAEPLLKASDRLGLERLKHFCEESLADNYVCYDNLDELWILTRRYRSAPLHNYGADFLGQHCRLGPFKRPLCGSQPCKELVRKYLSTPLYQGTMDYKFEVYCPPDIL